MGKTKRLRIVKTGGFEQQSTEVEHPIEEPHSTLSEATDSVQSDYGPQKKVRRHTRKQAIWDLESDERIEVNFNELGQPVGDEGKEFTSFLGTLVKMSKHLSIEYLHWRTIPEDKKEDLWNLVKGRFIFLPNSTDGGDLDWRNDDLAKVKGPEKGGHVRCLGKVVIAKEKGSSFSQDPQVPVLKARINELEDKMKEMGESKERQDAEMKELKDRQEAMMRFMAAFKEHLPNANLSNIFVMNTQAANDSSSVYDHPTSSHASLNSS